MPNKTRTQQNSSNLKPLNTLDFAELRIRNDRQTVFALTRELVRAQFELADQELSDRLWQDVIDRGINLERIINLMYCCSSHDDDQEMLEIDELFQVN